MAEFESTGECASTEIIVYGIEVGTWPENEIKCNYVNASGTACRGIARVLKDGSVPDTVCLLLSPRSDQEYIDFTTMAADMGDDSVQPPKQ